MEVAFLGLNEYFAAPDPGSVLYQGPRVLDCSMFKTPGLQNLEGLGPGAQGPHAWPETFLCSIFRRVLIS